MLSGLIISNLGVGAFATNIEALARLLIPAFMAQNFAAMCVPQDPQFLAGSNLDPASVSAFAEQVKMEVTAGISEQETASIRVTAADAAGAVARQEIDLLRGQQRTPSPEALRHWCNTSAKHFIVEIMHNHTEKRAEFEILLNKAKR